MMYSGLARRVEMARWLGSWGGGGEREGGSSGKTWRRSIKRLSVRFCVCTVVVRANLKPDDGGQ